MKDEILLRVVTDGYLYDLFVKNIGILECLNPDQRQVYKKALAFYKKYEKCPNLQEGKVLFNRGISIQNLSQEFTFDIVLNEIRTEKLKYWILNVAEDIENDEVRYDKVYGELSKLKDKLEAHLPKGSKADALVDSIVAIEAAKRRVDTISSGINALDYALRGGFHKGELAFLIAPPGRGKSVFLINLLHAFLVGKKTVLFLSNELRTDTVLSRFYRRIMKMGRSVFSEGNKQEIERGLGNFFKYSKGTGVIHYAPVDTWGVEDLKSWVTAWEKQSGKKVDAVLIDYFDRMQKPKDFEYRLRLRALVDLLRDYAVDKDIFIGTATQTNRSGLSAPLVTEEHVGEAFSKIESADVILSLSQSTSERDSNKARITVLKNREFGGAGSVLDVKVIWDELTITDFDYEE